MRQWLKEVNERAEIPPAMKIKLDLAGGHCLGQLLTPDGEVYYAHEVANPEPQRAVPAMVKRLERVRKGHRRAQATR